MVSTLQVQVPFKIELSKNMFFHANHYKIYKKTFLSHQIPRVHLPVTRSNAAMFSSSPLIWGLDDSSTVPIGLVSFLLVQFCRIQTGSQTLNLIFLIQPLTRG